MSEYDNPRPTAGTPYSDPCAVKDMSVTLGKLMEDSGGVTTYNGKSLMTLTEAIDKFGFGVAPFTFADGGTLSSFNLLVSNSPADNFFYKYVGNAVTPLVIAPSFNPVGSVSWEPFVATDAKFITSANVTVSGIKNLVVPTVTGQSFSVTGFYSGANVGGGEFIWDASKDKATHNGGTIIAPEAIVAWDGTQADLATLLSWTGTGIGCFVKVVSDVTPQHFGVTGSENDAAGFKAWLSCEQPLFGSGVVLLQDLVDVQDKNINLFGCDGTFMIIDDYVSPSGQQENLVNIRNNPSSTLAVTSIEKNITLGTSGIYVANATKITTASPHEYSVGDVVKLFSDDTIPYAKANQRQSEMGVVAELDSNSITISTSVTFDYTTNPRCVSLNSDRKLTLNLKSKTLRPDVGDVRHIFNIAGYVNPTINAECESSRGKFIYVLSCYNAKGTIKPRGLTDAPSREQYGYGVADYGSCFSTWDIVGAEFFRHAYTTGAPEHSAGYPDALEYGGAVDCTITSLTAVRGNRSAADTHPDSLRTTFGFVNTRQANKGGGVQLRGKGDAINSLFVSGVGNAITCSLETEKITLNNVSANITAGAFFYGATGNSQLNATINNADIVIHSDTESVFTVEEGNTVNLGNINITYSEGFRAVRGNSHELIAADGCVVNISSLDVDLRNLTGTPPYTSQIIRSENTESTIIIDKLKIRFGTDSINWVSRLINNNTTVANKIEIRDLELIPDDGVDISTFALVLSDLVNDTIIISSKGLRYVAFQSFSSVNRLWFTDNGTKRYINGNDSIVANVDRAATGVDITDFMPPARKGQRVLIKNIGAGNLNFDAAIFGVVATLLAGNSMEVVAIDSDTWQIL